MYYPLLSEIIFLNCSDHQTFKWTIENKDYQLSMKKFVRNIVNDCAVQVKVIWPNLDGIHWIMNSYFLKNFCLGLDFDKGEIGLANLKDTA